MITVEAMVYKECFLQLDLLEPLLLLLFPLMEFRTCIIPYSHFPKTADVLGRTGTW